MKIQKGIVKYKDRNDIVCTYGVSDDGIQYYFLDENDEKKMSNGNRIASTALVEAVDAMFKATRIGVIDKDGKVVIPFENKAIKPVNNDVLIVEKATPTSQNVLDAIEKRNDTTTAASLVAASAAIKDKMNAKMGADGRFLVNDQFSEATVCDIDGNNLVNDEYYSFIGVSGNNLYFSKNVPESDIIEFSLESKSIVEPDKSNEVIDVQNTGVDPQSVENALSDEVSNEKVLVKQPEGGPVPDVNAPLDLANFFQGEGIPEGEEVKGEVAADVTNALAAPMVDSETVKEAVEGKVEENMPAIPGPVEDDKEENEEVNAPVDVPPVVGEAMNNSEISPLDMPPVVDEEETKDDAINPVDMPPVVDEEKTKDDAINPMDMPPLPADVTPEVAEEKESEETEVKEEESMIPPVVDEEEEEKVHEDVAAVNLSNPVSFNPSDLGKLSDDKEEAEGKEEVEDKVEDSVSVPPIDSVEEEKVVEKEEVTIPAPIEDETPVAEETPDVSKEEVEDEKPVEFNHNVTTVDPSDVASIVDKDNDGVLDSNQFKSDITKINIDDIDLGLDDKYDSLNSLSDIDNFDDYRDSSSNDDLMSEVAHYMSNSMKQIKEQKSTITKLKDRYEESESQRRTLVERLKDQVSRNESLASKIRSIDSLTNELKSKVKDQKRIIDSQERELKSLRSQLNSKKEIAQLLADAKTLLNDDSYDDGDSYTRRAA